MPFSQFQRFKNEVQIHMYIYFQGREYPHELTLEAWEQTKEIPKTKVLSPKTPYNKGATPIMFITTSNRANPNFREMLSNHLCSLGRSSATRNLQREHFMISYRRPTSLKDLLLRARISQPIQPQSSFIY